MINLLPIEYKKCAKREFLRRFFTVFGGLILVIIFTQIICLLFLHFWFDTLSASYAEELELTKKISDIQKLEELENKADILNRLSSVYKDKDGQFRPHTFYIGEVLDILPPSISIENFVMSKRDGLQMNISGNAATRNDLLSFISNLENSSWAERVESPLSNLLFTRDVDFVLAVSLRK